MRTPMISFLLLRPVRSLLFVMFVLLFACCPQEAKWKLEKIHTAQRCHNFSRLYFTSSDPFCPLELEILGNRSSFRVFLNLLSAGVTEMPFQDSAIIKISTSDEIQVVQAHLYQGGQKALLPPTAVEFIVANLLEWITVTIEVGRYQAIIVPSNFSKAYGQFLK